MTQYDALAARLADIEKIIGLLREHVEFPSFLRALGDIRGKRVLDVGCGDGTYARMVARQGAVHVEGMDSSAEMIGLAESIEREESLGIRYHVHDLATMPTLGVFDLVVAVNVLHYADSRATLEAMCRKMASHLAPGGRLLAYVGNAEVDPDAVRDFGFVVDRPASPSEGDAYTITVPLTPPASVEVRYWPATALADAVTSAGFTRVGWEEIITSADSTATDDERLRRLLKSPPSLLLSALKE